MKAGSPSKIAGWPRIVAILCLLLTLPGCASYALQEKIDSGPRPPSQMGTVESAGRSVDGTVVSLCMDRDTVMVRVPVHSNEQQNPRKKPNGTDRVQPNQTGVIPYLSVPANTALRYCLKPNSPIPAFRMTADHVSGRTYKFGRIDPGTNWGATDNIPLAVVMSDERLRKEIRDRIIVHEAPVGIYQIPVTPPGGASSRSAVFYKYSVINTAHPESGSTRVVQLGISGGNDKPFSSWALLWPVAIAVDIVTSPVQVIVGAGFIVYIFFCDCLLAPM